MATKRPDAGIHHGTLVRMRLSEWARQEGISRITAYRMLRRGILPVVSECSPTGRWYVLVPSTRNGRTTAYVRAAPGPQHVAEVNAQVDSLSRWAKRNVDSHFSVVREIANPFTDRLPRLEALVFDPRVTEIVIDNPSVVGDFQFPLLVAALGSQGRKISVLNGQRRRNQLRKADLNIAIARLCVLLHGDEVGVQVARSAISTPNPASDAT